MRAFLLAALIFAGAIPSRGGQTETAHENLYATEDFRVESAGMRFGFGANSTARGLLEAEAFSNFTLPWRWKFGDVRLYSRFDLTAGWLGGHAENAAEISAGPTLTGRYREWPIHLTLGTSPTLLSQHKWGSADIGSNFQFSTHVEAEWEVTTRIRVGYRFMHLSNAGFARPNPGLNMHLFGISYLF